MVLRLARESFAYMQNTPPSGLAEAIQFTEACGSPPAIFLTNGFLCGHTRRAGVARTTPCDILTHILTPHNLTMFHEIACHHPSHQLVIIRIRARPRPGRASDPDPPGRARGQPSLNQHGPGSTNMMPVRQTGIMMMITMIPP
jgi:hypothetical protein